ncbi:hypothetical protein EOE18_15865 [Novosphingobium umbonatum]|uniref:Uncharacterized protein n=1 Tax=Novosphingobium umbonatum TaxID=1908524 RepID=A0A437N0J7_9SPHN|nr:hypothetical protein [Novosphingobium umbonatum]RVU03429.1 hypothetical protein EOE18_15865 [Novosphingobium umbonatum]
MRIGRNMRKCGKGMVSCKKRTDGRDLNKTLAFPMFKQNPQKHAYQFDTYANTNGAGEKSPAPPSYQRIARLNRHIGDIAPIHEPLMRKQ